MAGSELCGPACLKVRGGMRGRGEESVELGGEYLKTREGLWGKGRGEEDGSRKRGGGCGLGSRKNRIMDGKEKTVE